MSDYTGADIFNEFKEEREDRLESKLKGGKTKWQMKQYQQLTG